MKYRKSFDDLEYSEAGCPSCGWVFDTLSAFDRHLVPDRKRLRDGYMESGGPWCRFEKKEGSVTRASSSRKATL